MRQVCSILLVFCAWVALQAVVRMYRIVLAHFKACSYSLLAAAAAAAAAGGHYTADVQQGDGRWLHFNDAEVDQVSQKQVLEQKPYLLVYQRV
jgi:ubiquitin C-terminal hydrolase